MTQITNKPMPKLPKAPQPPLSYPGATADSDRAKKPSLSEASATEQANEDDAVVKWDDDGRVRLHQPSLKKV